MKPSRILLPAILALSWASEVRADLESFAYLTPSYPATLAEGQSLAFPFSNLPLYGSTTTAFGNYAKGSLEYTMGDRARLDVKFYESALDAMLGNVARAVTLDSTGSVVKEIAFLPFAPEFSPQGWMDREGVLTVTVTRGTVTVHKLGAVVVKDSLKYTGDSSQSQYLDSDGDGLTDAEEATRGTNPNLKDTDSDGVTDGREVADGTNPNDVNSYNNLSKNLVAYYPFNGNANDESGSGNHGAVNGVTIGEDRHSRSHSSYLFNGTSFIRIANSESLSLGTNDVSVSAWIKTSGRPSAYIYSDDSDNHRPGFELTLTGSVAYYEMSSSAQGWSYGDGAKNIANNAWHHVIVTFKRGGLVSLYVDGVLDVSEELNPLITSVSNSVDSRIGMSPDGYHGFVGNIDDLRIYSRALSAAEVAQLYGQEVDPAASVSEVLARWDFSGGLGPTSTATGIAGNELSTAGVTFLYPTLASGNPDPGVEARAWLGGRDNGRYYTFRVTNNLTVAVPVTSIRMDLRNESPGIGPTGFAVMSSADNYASDVASGTLDWSTRAWVNVNAKMNTVLQPGQALEFRVTGWGANSIPPQGGHLIMDNVVVMGGASDTDGDGLSDAWEMGYGRYQIVPGNFNWNQAKADAEARGGHLSTITSQAESDFIYTILGSTLGDNSHKDTWLGANDATTEGDWRWVTGEEWSYSRWGPSEPNGSTIENYLMLKNGTTIGHIPGITWNDSGNSQYLMYLLEFGYPTDPTKADTDGDGFDDKAETIAGTDPNSNTAFPDTEAPVITLIGANPLEIYKGSIFTDPGATVTDNVDATRTITGIVTSNSTMFEETVGIYTVTYTAADAAGNLALPVTRTVNVVLDPAADEDGDGLTNGTEISGGTNPYQKDSDGDGVNDPVEIADGTNPNDVNSYNNLNKGLVAYYPFNGNINDESGSGKHLVLEQSELTSDSVASSALKFSNSSSRAETTQNLGVTGNSPRTVSFWVKTDRPLASYGDVIGWGPAHQGMTNRTGFQIVLLDRAGGEIVVWSDYGDRSASGIGNPFTGRFEMVTYVYSDSINGAKIYLGGQSLPIGQGGGWVASGDVFNTLDTVLRLGSRATDAGSANWSLPGMVLDNVRIYNRALSATEVGHLYQQEAGSLDADGDGLTDAWERGYGRYQIVPGNFSWEEARSAAGLITHPSGIPGHLGVIPEERIQSIVMDLIGQLETNWESVWIGGSRINGVWTWLDGRTVDYANWGSGEPANGPSEDLMSITAQSHHALTAGDWNDDFASSRYPYLLEFGYWTDPTLADTDGDGFNDSIESHYASDPNNAAVTPNTIRPAGAVVAWGDNQVGQTNVPSSISTNAVQISSGYAHALALKKDGSVVAWGENLYGKRTVPAGLTNVVSVSAGAEHSAALLGSGRVVVWGDNRFGQTNLPAEVSAGIVAIQAGQVHTLALTASGKVIAWGSNENGQSTVPPEALSGVVAIGAGERHSIALTAPGKVIAWGAGQTNSGSYPNLGQSIVPSSALSGVNAISAFNCSNLILKDGQVLAWGDNYGGQVNPLPAESQSGVTQISLGLHHAAALKSNGQVIAWGRNQYGQATPPLITQSGALAVSAGGGFTTAIVTSAPPAGIAPLITSTNSLTGTVGVALSNTVTASGSTPITFSATNLPFGLNIATGGLISGTPTTAGSGTATITASNAYGATTNNLAWTIAPKTLLTINVATVNGKEYDGNRTANVDFSLAELEGVSGGHDVQLVSDSAVGTYENASAGVGKSVSVTGLSLSGADAGRYEIGPALLLSGDINKRDLTISNVSVLEKTYDGSVIAPLEWGGHSLSGYVNGEGSEEARVGSPYARGKYLDAWVGTNKRVIGWFELPVLVGSGKDNYRLVFPTNLTGTIVKGVVVPEVSGTQKVYDGGRHEVVGKAMVGSNNLAVVTKYWGLSNTVYPTNEMGPTNAGVYGVEVKVAESEQNYGGATNVVLTIAKKAAVIAANSDTIRAGTTFNSNNYSGSGFLSNDVPTGSLVTHLRGVTNTNPLVGYSTTNNQSGVYRILRGDVGENVSHNYQIEYREGTLTVLKESLLTEGAVSPLAAGLHYTLVVKSQGTVGAFGSNTNGVTNLPTILTDGTAEVAGVGSGAAANFGMAWTRDGAGVVWGSLTNTNVSGANGLTNVAGMAGGNGFVGYVRGDGTVGVWGTNLPAEGVVPSSLTNSHTAGVVGVAVGDSHLLAVRTNGSVVGWGTYSGWGANGGVVPGSLSNAVGVGAGIYHGVAVKGDGTVAVWGNNTFGGLNVPPELTSRSTNTFVRAVAVAAGYQYSLVLRADGTVRGWGSGSPTNLPFSLSSTMGVNPIVSLALEQNHAVAMQRDGTVTTWLPTAGSVESNSLTLLVPAGLKGRVPMGGADSDRDGWANEAELRVGSDPLSTNSYPMKASFGVNFSYGSNASTFTTATTVEEGTNPVVGTLAILDTMGRLEDGNQTEMTVELTQESLNTFEPVSRTNRELRFKTNPVYDGVRSNNVYKVEVLVRDSETSAALMTTLAVNVGNVAPQITGNTSFAIDENVAMGSGVGTLAATESNVTWSITSGNGLGLFAIDGQSGQIRTAGAIDYEALSNKTITLGVRVTDAGGAASSADVAITVRDVDEGMTPQLWLAGSGWTEMSPELWLKYAVGGALSPTGSSENTVTMLDSEKLSLTAIIRTNDLSLRVLGEAGVDLSSWQTNGVSEAPTASQDGVPDGSQRRIYSVDRTNSPSRQFLRLRVTR